MKIFITGASGFIGRVLVKRLAQNPADSLICLTRDLRKVAIPVLNNIQFVEGDIGDEEAITELTKDIDIIFHLAGYLEYGNINKTEMTRTNVKGIENILKAAKTNNVSKIIYISTAAIFHPTKDKVVDENSSLPEKHLTLYTETKTLGHEYAREYAQNNPGIIFVLPVSVYGESSPFFKNVADSIKGSKFQFIPMSACRLSLINVDDLCEGIELSAIKGRDGESYVFSGDSMEVSEIFLRAAEILNKKISIIRVPDKIMMYALTLKGIIERLFGIKSYFNKELFLFVTGNLVASDKKARQELSWAPKTNLSEGFKKMILSFK